MEESLLRKKLKRFAPKFPHASPDVPCARVTRTRLCAASFVVTATVLLLLLHCVTSRSKAGACCFGSAVTSDSLNKDETQTSQDLYLYHNQDSSQSHSVERLRHSGDLSDAHLQQHLPHVIIIGVRKGGTRALLEFLNLHPQIAAAKPEMHFFDDDDNYTRGIEWYRSRMPWSSPEQLTIEKTPAYFNEEVVPRRVYRMNSTCRFLLIVRDPTERAISDYSQIYFNRLAKNKPFERFEELALDRRGNVRKSYKAIRRSMYYKHMLRWLRYFPLEQFHVVDGEQLVENPVPQLRNVETFLGLQHELTADRFYYNTTRGFYCMRTAVKERCLAPSKGRVHPTVRPQVITTLRRYFEPMNQEFYSLVHQDLGWPAF